MKTIIHSYYFNLDPRSRDFNYASREYGALREELSGMGLHCFNVLAMQDTASAKHRDAIDKLNGRPVELETAHLFDNQWNTAPVAGISDTGLRVFDWYEGVYPNRAVKRGHWLEQTDEMRAIRRDTLKCGYCGNQEPVSAGLTFCPRCLDSEYLKLADLKLLRLTPIDQTGFSNKNQLPALTEAEHATLYAAYMDAQQRGNVARAAAKAQSRAARIERRYVETLAKAQDDIANAEIVRNAERWALARVPHVIDNLIYYSHMDRFAFGWRDKLDAATVSALLDVISEFPYPYDLKCADGRTLSGER